MPQPTKNLKGKKFGRWTVLKEDRKETKLKHKMCWLCKCQCGIVKTVYYDSLVSGKSKSCGCGWHKPRPSKRIQIKNQRFGRWVALKCHPKKPSLWLCKCDCGAKKYAWHQTLRNGVSKSCGCLHRELTGSIFRTHGMSGTKVYRTWQKIKDRCNNTNNDQYKDYGGRGIKVYAKWNKSFTDFYKHIGDPPTPKHTIERMDNNGDYKPGNVKWATYFEQANNTRRTPLIEHNGTHLTVAQWSRKLNKSRKSLYYHLKKYSVDVAFKLAKSLVVSKC